MDESEMGTSFITLEGDWKFVEVSQGTWVALSNR